jgi:hypothetical protein
MFTLGSVLSATAWTPGLFIAGDIIQGLFTSMMLIAAARRKIQSERHEAGPTPSYARHRAYAGADRVTMTRTPAG